jgi:hypothetical protein
VSSNSIVKPVTCSYENTLAHHQRRHGFRILSVPTTDIQHFVCSDYRHSAFCLFRLQTFGILSVPTTDIQHFVCSDYRIQHFVCSDYRHSAFCLFRLQTFGLFLQSVGITFLTTGALIAASKFSAWALFLSAHIIHFDKLTLCYLYLLFIGLH